MDEYAPPQTETQRAVAQIWQEVLGIDGAEMNDDFLQLGGRSLHAVQILARIHEQYGIQLTARDIFLAPTIASLAALVDERSAAEIEIEEFQDQE